METYNLESYHIKNYKNSKKLHKYLKKNAKSNKNLANKILRSRNFKNNNLLNQGLNQKGYIEDCLVDLLPVTKATVNKKCYKKTNYLLYFLLLVILGLIFIIINKLKLY